METTQPGQNQTWSNYITSRLDSELNCCNARHIFYKVRFSRKHHPNSNQQLNYCESLEIISLPSISLVLTWVIFLRDRTLWLRSFYLPVLLSKEPRIRWSIIFHYAKWKVLAGAHDLLWRVVAHEVDGVLPYLPPHIHAWTHVDSTTHAVTGGPDDLQNNQRRPWTPWSAQKPERNRFARALCCHSDDFLVFFCSFLAFLKVTRSRLFYPLWIRRSEWKEHLCHDQDLELRHGT